MPINSRIRLDVELDGLTFGDLYEFVDLGRAGGVDPDTEVELTSTDPDDPRADGFGADVPLPDAVVVNLDSHRGPGAGQDDGDVDEESAQDEEQAVDEESSDRLVATRRQPGGGTWIEVGSTGFVNAWRKIAKRVVTYSATPCEIRRAGAIRGRGGTAPQQVADSSRVA